MEEALTVGGIWSNAADFSACPDQPYWLNDRRLLEVPVTIAGKRSRFLPDKWFAYRWLRPSIMTASAMKRLIDTVLIHHPENTTLNR